MGLLLVRSRPGKTERVPGMAGTTKSGTTRRSVLVSFVVNCAETLGLAVAAGVTGSVALRAQTAANAADVAVQVFLLIGVLSSVRPPDQAHPFGYGRERFFWSLLAALGIFLGGGVLGLDEAVHAALHPSAIHSYLVAYLVLVTTVVLDAFALQVGLRPVREQAAGRGISLRDYLGRSTDPASTTVVVAGGCSVIGGITATAGLVLSRGDRKPGAGHGGQRADRPAAAARLGAVAANEPGSSVRARRFAAHAPRNVPGHRRTGGGGRCPGPVRDRGRAIEPGRRRRCHLRPRPGPTGGGTHDPALHPRAPGTLAQNQVRLPHPSRQAPAHPRPHDPAPLPPTARPPSPPASKSSTGG